MNHKKRPRASLTWKVIDERETDFKVGDTVYDRDRKQRSVIVAIGTKSVTFQDRKVKQSRLSKVYGGTNVVYLTASTTIFRQLAASETTFEDRVLEIGCSSGETSSLIWKNRVAHFVGLDTSQEMVARVNEDLPKGYKCLQLDALMEPDKVLDLIPDPTVILIDIGGNRELAGVLNMLDFVLGHYSPRSILIKSEALRKVFDEKAYQQNEDWLESLKAKVPRRFPNHPLQAPRVLSPKDQRPICRYHNYHKDGCKQDVCEFDHEYCHWCLEKGHKAFDCQKTSNSLKH